MDEWSRWRGTVDLAGLASGQVTSRRSGKLFCGERGLLAWQFYAWKKRPRDTDGCKFVHVKVAVDVRQEPMSAGSRAIEVRLRHK